MFDSTPQNQPSINSYNSLIKKAYIEPIRTVTIVDDDYPTLDSVIRHQRDGISGSWEQSDLNRLEAFISVCRRDRSWAVDVYDGQSPDLNDVPHINNSDLVVLDYHLDPSIHDSGEKALECVRVLASNNHFNLVVVHTKGYDGDIRQVFAETLCSLKKIPEIPKPDENSPDDIDEFFDDQEIDQPDTVKRLKESVDLIMALKVCEGGQYQSLYMNPNSSFGGLKGDIDQLTEGSNITGGNVIWWLVKNKIQCSKDLFSSHDTTALNWEFNEDRNWISSGKIFITVIQKSKETEEIKEIPEKLVLALEGSLPSPMLLLMARMRYELEEYGFLEATKIVDQEGIQAAWLHQLLSSSNESRNVVSDKVVEKHWDRISTETKPRLREFANEISNAFSEKSHKGVIKHLFGKEIADEPNISIAALNCYNCSREVSEHHLITGHILEFSEGSAQDLEKEYWVCMSPACDLVPNQKTSGWYGRIGPENMPFKAVKLKGANLKGAISKANTNRYIFLNINDSCIDAFEFPDGKNTNPEWEQMFASDGGRFREGNMLTVNRITQESPRFRGKGRSQKKKLHDGSKVLTFKSYENVRVVSELRYEYAINLLQRLGGNLSRVGLDFVKELWDR